MVYKGVVKNKAIVLQEPLKLPDGTTVEVKVPEKVALSLEKEKASASVEPTAAENSLPFSDEELEQIAACGPSHPRYWETLEAVAERFNAFLEQKGYTLEKMLADLPVARQALWEQKYALLLKRAQEAEETDE